MALGDLVGERDVGQLGVIDTDHGKTCVAHDGAVDEIIHAGLADAPAAAMIVDIDAARRVLARAQDAQRHGVALVPDALCHDARASGAHRDHRLRAEHGLDHQAAKRRRRAEARRPVQLAVHAADIREVRVGDIGERFAHGLPCFTDEASQPRWRIQW